MFAAYCFVADFASQVASFRDVLETKMARLRADIGRLLSLVAELRSSWLLASPTPEPDIIDDEAAGAGGGGDEGAPTSRELAVAVESSEEEAY